MQSLKELSEGPLSCDVLVAGGGVAGVAAAVSAARRGCSVVLAESSDRLGGIGTRGMLRTICGLYQNSGTAPSETLNPGLVREIVAALRTRAPQRTVQRIGKVFVLPCSATDLEAVLRSLVQDRKGPYVLLECAATAAASASGRITEVTVEQHGLRKKVMARAVVDCTGNGELAFLAGAEHAMAPAGELQLAGFTVQVKGLAGPDDALALKVPYVLAKAAESGVLPALMRFTTFAAGDGPDEGYVKFSVDGGFGPDRESQVRNEVMKAIGLLKEHVPSFGQATVVRLSGILPREGRRIVGEYVLTEQDVLSARKFPDGVVRNSWPLESWDASCGTVYRYVRENDHYDIPFRCLRARGVSNLLAAGRCISVTHAALASTRVMATCLALGDVAGQAAAELAQHGRYPDFGHET